MKKKTLAWALYFDGKLDAKNPFTFSPSAWVLPIYPTKKQAKVVGGKYRKIIRVEIREVRRKRK